MPAGKIAANRELSMNYLNFEGAVPHGAKYANIRTITNRARRAELHNF
jgi:hypothetical protein